MVPFLLNAEQKTLLHSLVPGLKSARIGLNGKVILSTHLTFIYEDGRINLRSLGWEKQRSPTSTNLCHRVFFQVTDFDRMGVPSKYLLDDALIIQAAENYLQ
jgi:hypothetical protein